MTSRFRAFTVAKKVVESEIISSFYFQPSDGEPLWPFKPGQYLTLKIPTDKGDVLKTYSLSNSTADKTYHRITVKREAGLNGAPDGIGSCWLHDHLHVGDNIDIAPPRGEFTLDEDSTRPVLLLSGGVGLTPLVSMLHQLSNSNRDVYFLHACENGQVHALQAEVSNLTNDHIKVLSIYRNPSSADKVDNTYDAAGFIDKQFLDKNIPQTDYDVYLCGPTPFMEAMYTLALDWGINKNQISYEFFGKASSLEIPNGSPAAPKQIKAAINAPENLKNLEYLTNPDAWAEVTAGVVASNIAKQAESLVTFSQSKKSATWDGSAKSLLALAEDAGLDPSFSCRAGICGTCACKLVAGEVEYNEEPLQQAAKGEVLICCATPKGPVTLEL